MRERMEMSSYVNHPRRPRLVHDSPPTVTERKWSHILLLSFGILCLIQATLNITLRLTAKSECSATVQESETSPPFEQETQQCNRQRERVKALEAERNRLENKNRALANQINVINNRNSQLTNQNQDLKRQINGANDQVKECNNQNRGLNTQINEFNNQMTELRNKNSELTNQVERLNNLLRVLRDKNKALIDQSSVVTVLQETVAVRPACPDGWREMKSRCYFLSSERRSWDSSRRHCLSLGADLVVINNEQEQRDLYQMNGDRYLLFWIGLHDATNSGMFKWVDDTPLTTTFWQAGQPGDGGPNHPENCVEMYHENPVLSSWNDARCADSRRWVCEKEAHK